MKSDEFANALIAQLPALRRYAVALSGNAVQGDDLVQDCVERALRQSLPPPVPWSMERSIPKVGADFIKTKVDMTYAKKCADLVHTLRHSLFCMRYRVRRPVPGRFQPYRHTLPDRYPWLFRFTAAALEGRKDCKLLSFGCSRGDEVRALRQYFPRARDRFRPP